MNIKPPSGPLGEVIRTSRHSHKFTQQQLAEHVGLRGAGAGAYISRVEGGRQVPTTANLCKLAKVLKIPIGELAAMNAGS